MAEVVVSGPQAMVDAFSKDDVLSRMTLIVRDGAAVDVKAPKVVIVEGPEDGVARARTITKDNGGEVLENGSEVAAKIRAEEDAAAEGVGFLFD